MNTLVAVALGGGVGCLMRYGLSNAFPTAATKGFPLATLVINVVGSFLIGFLAIGFSDRFNASPALRAGILSGGLGGFTTFSAFSMDALMLIDAGAWLRAALYVFLSVMFGLVAAFAGVILARQFIAHGV